MNAILIITIGMSMNGMNDQFLDLVLRIPQPNIEICEEVKKDIRSNVFAANKEIFDEYEYKIKGTWCVDK